MFLVGLSGGIASGKSTVVAVLRELGCAVIDADVIAREVVQPHFKAYQQIVNSFGTEILLENGEINRQALGNIIFSQPEKRQLLNSITHPEIQKEMLKQILKYFVLGYHYVILDIPLLFETNRLTKFMKYTVLVYWSGPAPSRRTPTRTTTTPATASSCTWTRGTRSSSSWTGAKPTAATTTSTAPSLASSSTRTEPGPTPPPHGPRAPQRPPAAARPHSVLPQNPAVATQSHGIPPQQPPVTVQPRGIPLLPSSPTASRHCPPAL